jgi:hypothetical protein
VMTQSGDFEAEDTRRDRKACVEAEQVCGHWAFVRWTMTKKSEFALEGHVSLVS